MIVKAGRGRKAALITAVLGLAVLAGAAFVLRDRIRVEWWIYRLGSQDPQAMVAAIQELARMGPAAKAALPALATALEDPAGNMKVREDAEAAMEIIGGQIEGPLVILEPPSVECEAGGEAMIEFRAALKKHVRAFFIHFEIPKVPVKLLRAEVTGTASARFPSRTVAYDPHFFKGGFQVGVNTMDSDFQPLIATGEHVTLIKALVHFESDAKPGDHAIQIKSADFAALKGSLNSRLALPGDGVIHLKPATGPPPVPQAGAAPVAPVAPISPATPAIGSASTSPDQYVIWADDAFAEPGTEKVAVKMFATSSEPAQAFSFALRVDPKLGKLRKVGIEKTVSEAAEIDQFVYQKHAVAKGETAAGFLFDTVPPYGHLFPPGTNQHVATVMVDVPAGAPSGSSIPIELGSFGEPPGSNVFAVKGQSKSAVIHAGTIYVGESPVPPPIELEAKVEPADGKNVVRLSWRAVAIYDSIRIERDWKTLQVIDGELTTFRDEEAGPGAHRYRVFGRRSNKEGFPTSIWTGTLR
jgi:hypothetical protein